MSDWPPSSPAGGPTSPGSYPSAPAAAPPGPTYGQPGGYGPPSGYGPPFAGFGTRLGAFLLDGLITLIGPGLAVLALLAGPKSDKLTSCTVNGEARLCRNPAAVSVGLFVLLVVVSLAFALWYHVFLLGRTGQTVGARSLGIKVVGKATGRPIGPGRAFVRYLVELIASGLLCGLGYLWMLWDPENQTWQDKAADSYVIQV